MRRLSGVLILAITLAARYTTWSQEAILQDWIHIPGAYKVDCTMYTVPFPEAGLSGSFSVLALEVLQSGDTKVHVVWETHSLTNETLKRTGPPQQLNVGPDDSNTNIYLTDDCGNRYDHTATDESARRQKRMSAGDGVRGWFVFPPPHKKARRLFFHDADQDAACEITVKRSPNKRAVQFPDANLRRLVWQAIPLKYSPTNEINDIDVEPKTWADGDG